MVVVVAKKHPSTFKMPGATFISTSSDSKLAGQEDRQQRNYDDRVLDVVVGKSSCFSTLSSLFFLPQFFRGENPFSAASWMMLPKGRTAVVFQKSIKVVFTFLLVKINFILL